MNLQKECYTTANPVVKAQANNYKICYQAVSGILTAVDYVLSQVLDNTFCAVRPPGHHAENDGEFGFCFFSNVAIAARYAQEKYKIKHILIINWDFHHGNGTEKAFYSDPSILFFSTHNLNVLVV